MWRTPTLTVWRLHGRPSLDNDMQRLVGVTMGVTRKVRSIKSTDLGLFLRIFNSPRLHQNSVGNSGLFPKTFCRKIRRGIYRSLHGPFDDREPFGR
jgi:hypothetical protein